MTDYFAWQAVQAKKKCLVVCHNGGSQRGHTVVLPNGVRHVFHHFGSGTLAGADTYLSKEFIVNPMVFRKEFLQLKDLGVTPKCYINFQCRVSSPYDMLINQIVENSRGDKRHGSCGMGIWETIVRHQNGLSTTMGKYDTKSATSIEDIRQTYLPQRLQDLGIKTIDIAMLKLINNKELMNNYLEDLKFLRENTCRTDDSILQAYATVIFEGGQGLLLDQARHDIHSTPSSTGVINPLAILEKADLCVDSFEICYVTRTYLTKHGAGDFQEECNKDEINPLIVDMTNVPNEFQGEIRYGKIDDFSAKEMKQRIFEDFDNLMHSNPPCPLRSIRCSLAITHINECNPSWLPEISKAFDHAYLSNGLTRTSNLTVFS